MKPAAAPAPAATATPATTAARRPPITSRTAAASDGPLAAPAGWPDITDELAEVRFLLLQGFEDEAATMLVALRTRFEGHPDLLEVAAEAAPPPPVDPAERRRRDQAVTVRTEPVAAAAAAAAADADRVAADRGQGAQPGPDASAPSTTPRSTPAVKPTPSRVVGSTTAPTVTIAVSDEPPATDPAAPPNVVRAPMPAMGRNAQRVPPRGLTIRSEAIEGGSDSSPTINESSQTLVAQSRAPRAPDPASLVAVSPLDRPTPSAADSVSETIEFDVDAELEAAEGAAGSSATVSGMGESSSTLAYDDDVSDTIVDLEFEHLDRTVVSRGPPAPPSFDDEPSTSSGAAAAPTPQATSEGTVIARAPSKPAPYRAQQDDDDRPTTNASSSRVQSAQPAEAPTRTTVVPTTTDRPPVPAPFGGVPPPGSTLVPGTTPPAGGFPQDENLVTVALPTLTEASLATPQTPAVTGQTAPQAVVPTSDAAPGPSGRDDGGRGRGRGRGRKEPRTGGVRLVMLGARGESVAERTIEAGAALDLGRDGNQPWSDDTFIEPMHARFTATPSGVSVDELVPTGAVFLRIQGRRPLHEDDQVRVGQSLLSYRRPQAEESSGPWGSVVMHIAPDGDMLQIPLGNAGVTVGREFGEITLPGDTFVSSTHCRVVTAPGTDGGIFIEDLDSSNGTYVRLRAGERLEVGQCVLIGQTQFVIRKR